MSKINKLSVSNFVTINGKLWVILEISHNKTARRGAVVKLKIRNVSNRNIINYTVSASDDIRQTIAEKILLDFLYAKNNNFVFWNNNTFSEEEVSKVLIDPYDQKYLVEDLTVEALLYEDNIVSINIPEQISVKIKSTADNVSKGNTVSSAQKQAILENDIMCDVPLFVKTGDTIIYNTKIKKYLKRGKE